MYTVTIKVEAKGEGNDDFEQNVTIENLHVKSVEGVNFIQRHLAEAMFGMADAAAKVGKGRQ